MKTVTIIGGSGARNTLKALENIPNIKINNIVTMFDSGGSSGYMRKAFDIYAVGDLRDRILAVSKNAELSKISSERVETKGVKHSIGNLILYSLIKTHGDGYLDAAKRLFETPENIDFMPITDDVNCSADLVIKTDRGDLVGEDSLDSATSKDINITDVQLNKKVTIGEAAAVAIRESDFLIFGPGDIYSSILPNTLVEGFYEAMSQSKAKKILITNIMNKDSESKGFKASDFVELFSSRGLNPDYVIVNQVGSGKGTSAGKYTSFSGFVKNDIDGKENTVSADIANENIPYEHDPTKLSIVLQKVIQ